jgi:hypothetical protein
MEIARSLDSGMRSESKLESEVGRREEAGTIAFEFDSDGSKRSSWSDRGLLAKMCRGEAISTDIRRRKVSKISITP